MCWKVGTLECTTLFCPREPGTSLTLTCIKSECPAQPRMGGFGGFKWLVHKIFFVSPASFIIPAVYCLFVFLLTYVICLSQKYVRSSLDWESKVLTFAVKESCFVSLSTFKNRIVLWLLCSIPFATLPLIFPHWSYICKKGNSKERKSGCLQKSNKSWPQLKNRFCSNFVQM